MISFIKPVVKEIGFRVSKNEAEIRLKNEVVNTKVQWSSIIEKSGNHASALSSVPNKTKILFVTGYGLGSHFLQLEPVVMMSLRSRGCEIVSLYCNKSLPSCEFNPVGNNRPAALNKFKDGISNEAIQFRCNKCRANINEIYGELPIELNGLEKYLTEADYDLAHQVSLTVDFDEFRKFIFNDIKVGEEAFASILRVTFMGEVKNSRTNRHLVQRYIMSGILTAIAYEKAYLDIKPDRVVCIHGVYQTHGLAVKVANKLSIPVIVMGGGGIRKDTVIVCHNETYHNQLVKESNDVWQQFELTPDERQKTLEYAVKKRNNGGGADYISYHPNPIEDVDALIKYCDIDRSRPIVSMYTNVIWDAQIFYEGNAFKDIFDWLFSSIEELGKNENIWVVVRIHPAESKGGLPTRQPMLAEIQNRFRELPPNVRIIPPESDISSYTLAKISLANIIYGTKMGLEIALMQRPLIICGETFSRNKGYGIDVIDKTSYKQFLESIHTYNFESEIDERFEKAIRYAHFFYFRKMMDMPFKTAQDRKELLFTSLEELSDGKNPTLDVICEGIINLSDFYIGANKKVVQ